MTTERDFANLLAPRSRPADWLHDKAEIRLCKVAAVNTGDNTVDLYFGGDTTVTIPHVPRLASYSPTVNDNVWVLYQDNALLVIGKEA